MGMCEWVERMRSVYVTSGSVPGWQGYCCYWALMWRTFGNHLLNTYEIKTQLLQVKSYVLGRCIDRKISDKFPDMLVGLWIEAKLVQHFMGKIREQWSWWMYFKGDWMREKTQHQVTMASDPMGQYSVVTDMIASGPSSTKIWDKLLGEIGLSNFYWFLVKIATTLYKCTERTAWGCNASHLYSTDSRIWFWPGYRPSWQIFMELLSPSRHMPRQYHV
jgi:hypothetical protein